MRSRQILRATLPTYARVVRSKFISRIRRGVLAKEHFISYIKQDILYLANYSQLIQNVSMRLEHVDKEKLAKSICRSEEVQSLYSKYLKSQGERLPDKKSNVCADYTNFTLALSNSTQPIEALASTMPCLLFYRLLGEHFRKHALTYHNTPYFFWVERLASYNDDKTDISLTNIGKIIDKYTNNNALRDPKLVEIAVKSARYELLLFEEPFNVNADNLKVTITKKSYTPRSNFFVCRPASRPKPIPLTSHIPFTPKV